MKKKVLAIVTAALIGTTAFAATASAASGTIDVISREDGSGTRGAFIELFGIEEKQGDEKVDMTTEDASITNSTSVMMTTVAGDENAIGYISLGSLNDTVKAVKIDGAEASAENVANDTYKVSRPFNIITTDKLSDAAQDFENYIMSADGQQIVEDNGYIKVADDAKAYEQSDAEGKVVVAGSSSVTPVMEKLKEAYEKANGGKITVEVQQSDSTTGITSAAEGICDIGMASRELKDEETKETMVIDPGGEADKIVEMLDILEANVKYIYLTHCHGDHIGAVSEVKSKKGGKILIHRDDAEGLDDENINLSACINMGDIELEPDSRVDDGDLIHVGSLEFRVIHTPGHTMGSSSLYCEKEGLLFSGDTLFRGTWGRTDLPTSSFVKIIDSITKKLLVLPDETIVYPGHGKSTLIKEEKPIYLELKPRQEC